MKHIGEYRNPLIAKKIAEEIRSLGVKPVRLMEVCGTHTTSIFKHGIRTILPDNITLISGPGCPVCVTPVNEIDAFITLSGEKDSIITTFGDLMRVPGTESTLAKERAKGKDIRIVSSPIDAVDIAEKNPDKKIVFLGIGFETTAPAIAGSIILAQKRLIKNYFVFSAHKKVPEALDALMEMKNTNINGFILPGHVSMIIGVSAYLPFFEKHKIPCAVAGFEAMDILYVISILIKQIKSGSPKLENGYKRVVSESGNRKALELIDNVFETVDTKWRGIGTIKKSGFKIRKEFSYCDAEKKFSLKNIPTKEPKGCACGEILTGLKTPTECALYKKKCTPATPVGPCMVSGEGTCAAYFKYH